MRNTATPFHYYPHVDHDDIRIATVQVAVPVDADGNVPDADDIAEWLRRGLTTLAAMNGKPVIYAADGKARLLPSVEEAWYDDAN